MIEVYDVVHLDFDNACCCTLKERALIDLIDSLDASVSSCHRLGYVIGVDKDSNQADVIFHELPYVIRVPMKILKKIGCLAQYAIDNKIERYIPGKCIKVESTIFKITHIKLRGYVSYDKELKEFLYAPRIYVNGIECWMFPNIDHYLFYPDDTDELLHEKGRTENILNTVYGVPHSKTLKEEINMCMSKKQETHIPTNPIEKVIFNDPATIVFWKDGTKTIVKCQEGAEFDPEKGLAMAISRHYLCDICGLERYDGVFERYLPKR